jgi:hypothetical protein
VTTSTPEPVASAPPEPPRRLSVVLGALFVALVGVVTVAWIVTLVVFTIRLGSAIF